MSDEPSADETSTSGEGQEQTDDDHALAIEDLQYPEFTFEDGTIGQDGAFDLGRDLSPDEAREFLEDLSGAIASHDVAVESPDGYVTLGVKPTDVDLSFSPDADSLVGDFAVTMNFRAKPMFVSDDPDGTKVGARGGKGFVPIEQLTTDRETFRCYNWIDDPTDP